MALVLIVDDDEMSQALLGVILERAGHSVMKASDGGTALDMAYAAPPDLAIIDETMPRMSGVELTRQIKQNPQTTHIPVIMTSAGMFVDGGSTLMQQTGADAVLLKPWLKSDLERMIQVFLDETGEKR